MHDRIDLRRAKRRDIRGHRQNAIDEEGRAVPQSDDLIPLPRGEAAEMSTHERRRAGDEEPHVIGALSRR